MAIDGPQDYLTEIHPQAEAFMRTLADLFDAPSRIWSLGPSLVFAAFDGGGRQAASDSARASCDQAVANYRSTVLTALQEVEDNLINVQNRRLAALNTLLKNIAGRWDAPPSPR